jgi:UPF0755 protein
LRRLLLGVVLLALLAAAGAGGGWLYLRSWLERPGPLRAEAVVTLPPGTGVAGIAGRLADAGAVDSPLLFRLGARLTGRDRALKAGEYALRPGMSPAAIVALLASGEVLLHKVAVPEGLTVREVWALLGSSEVLAGELPQPPPPEGALLPETYLVPRGEARARLAGKMREDMSRELEAAWVARAPDLPLRTPEEALTLASIIEKETRVPEEYPLVASVFVNRLRRGMRLQTDPTVIYALTGGAGARDLGRELTTADLELDHPYNTYKVAGLPPGPIANPGRGALAAALRPADTSYLYFVADGTGGHAFARTLEEHGRNVARWRRIKDRPAG